MRGNEGVLADLVEATAMLECIETRSPLATTVERQAPAWADKLQSCRLKCEMVCRGKKRKMRGDTVLPEMWHVFWSMNFRSSCRGGETFGGALKLSHHAFSP